MVSQQQVVDLFVNLAKEDNMAVTVNESVKGGLKVGACAAAGGLFLGPVGFAVGGAVGGALATATAQNFKPVHQVLADMGPGKRQQLYEEFRKATAHLTYADYAMLAAKLAADPSMKGLLLQLLKDFVVRELQMTLK